MKSTCVIAAAMALGAATLPGCPELAPPFDTTGSYSGDFVVGMEPLELIDGCGMIVSLDQNVQGIPFADGKLEGTVSLSFACLLPESLTGMAAAAGAANLSTALAAPGNGGADLGAAANLLGAASLLNLANIPVSGVLLPDGTLELNTPDFLGECTEARCVSLALVGEGADWDGDGMMDQLEGNFGGTISGEFGTLPLAGSFETFRAPDLP